MDFLLKIDLRNRHDSGGDKATLLGGHFDLSSPFGVMNRSEPYRSLAGTALTFDYISPISIHSK